MSNRSEGLAVLWILLLTMIKIAGMTAVIATGAVPARAALQSDQARINIVVSVVPRLHVRPRSASVSSDLIPGRWTKLWAPCVHSNNYTSRLKLGAVGGGVGGAFVLVDSRGHKAEYKVRWYTGRETLILTSGDSFAVEIAAGEIHCARPTDEEALEVSLAGTSAANAFFGELLLIVGID